MLGFFAPLGALGPRSISATLTSSQHQPGVGQSDSVPTRSTQRQQRPAGEGPHNTSPQWSPTGYRSGLPQPCPDRKFPRKHIYYTRKDPMKDTGESDAQIHRRVGWSQGRASGPVGWGVSPWQVGGLEPAVHTSADGDVRRLYHGGKPVIHSASSPVLPQDACGWTLQTSHRGGTSGTTPPSVTSFAQQTPPSPRELPG